MINWDKYKHFSEWEFDSHDEPGSGSYMDEHVLDMLRFARQKADTPFIINSACRSEWWNAKIGGVSDSEHLYKVKDGKLIKPCRAVDIGFNKGNFHKIMNGLTEAGFTRFGISFNSMFIHTDNSRKKTKDTTWDYDPNTQMLRVNNDEGWDR